MAETEVGGTKSVVEIQAVNSRYLDVSTRIPRECRFLEERIKRRVAEKIHRGRVEVNIAVKTDAIESRLFEIDKARAAGYHQALLQLTELFQLNSDIPLELVAGAEGIIQAATPEKEPEALWTDIQGCLGRAISDLDDMRRIEGLSIENDLNGRLKVVESELCEIEKMAHRVPLYHQKRLLERVAALTKGTVEIDPGRIAQEVAFLADKSDVSEEIVRIKSHLAQFQNLLHADESAGRKLIFLLQEIHREFNTMGSKAGDADITVRVVEVKSELEKMREQALNVE